MATIDYGDGERELVCTGWTQVIYEQEFHSDDNDAITGDLIADVMGKMFVTSEDLIVANDDGVFARTVIDYTRINWNAIRRGMWAMLRTAKEIADDEHRDAPDVPSFRSWEKSLLKCECDMNDIATLVMSELQRGLFRTGAAASGQTSEEA